MGIKHKNTRDSKWKNILKSRHFRSFFYITFLFTTVIFIIGGGQIIHASTPKNGIMITTAYYRTPYKAVTFLN